MAARTLLAIALLLAAPITHAEPQAMRNGLVALEFARSGGLFALGNPPSGTITLAPPILRSEATPDGRPLTAAETALLESLDPATLQNPPQSPARDLRSIAITMRFENRPPITLDLPEPPAPIPPSLAPLAAFLSREAEAAWQHRLGQIR